MAFVECRGLKYFEVHDHVAISRNFSYYYIPNTVLKISKDTKVISSKLLYIVRPAQIVIEEGNDEFNIIDEVIYSKDKETLIYYPTAKKERSFIIPNFVRKIASFAFCYCNLERIDILDTVKYIESSAFLFGVNTKEVHFVNKDIDFLWIEKDAFDSYASYVTLYVPIGKGYAYKHHPEFSKFKEVIIERYDRNKT